MAINVTSQLDFRSTKALEVRAQYATLVAMKAMVEADLNPGLVAYCEETKKKYEYHPENPVDATTGKWKEIKSLSKADFDSLATKAEVGTAKNEAINAAATDAESKYQKKADVKAVSVESQGLVHRIKYGNDVVGTINIPADLFVKSFEYDPTTKKLKITVNNADNSGTAKVTEVSVADFVQAYTNGTGLQLQGNQFALTSEYAALPAKVLALETTVGNSTSGLVKDVADLKARPNYELGHAGGGNKKPVMQEGNKLYVEVSEGTTYNKATADADGLMSKEHYSKLESIRGFIHAVNPQEYEEKRQAGKLLANSIYFLDASINRGTTPESFQP